MFASRNALLTPTISAPPPAGISDNFNRADSTSSPGPNWTLRSQTMGVNGNAAYPVSSGWCTASYNTPAAGDAITVTLTIGSLAGSGTDTIIAAVGANTAGQAVLAYFDSGTTVYLAVQSTWALGGFGVLAAGGVSYTAGDVFDISRDAAGVAIVYKNGVYSGLAADSSTIPRDSSHRLVGIGCNGGGANYRRIDNFSAV